MKRVDAQGAHLRNTYYVPHTHTYIQWLGPQGVVDNGYIVSGAHQLTDILFLYIIGIEKGKIYV